MFIIDAPLPFLRRYAYIKIVIVKAIGLDGLPARLLKDSAIVIADCVTQLVNLSIETGEVPSEWKQAKVVALFKSGNKLMIWTITGLYQFYRSYRKFWRKLSSISYIATYQKTLSSRLINRIFAQIILLSWELPSLQIKFVDIWTKGYLPIRGQCLLT